MLYLFLALAAQVINAGVVLLDKFLLTSKNVARPLVYVFYVSMLSGVAVYVLLAGLFFALSAVLVKMIFLATPFWNGFFWSRLGNVTVALPLLFWPASRRAIWRNITTASFRIKLLILTSKFFAGVAFLLILLSIKLGNVSLVSAVGGAQFVILIIFALIFTKKFPNYFYESVHHFHTVIQKVAAVILIVLGYFLLFL